MLCGQERQAPPTSVGNGESEELCCDGEASAGFLEMGNGKMPAAMRVLPTTEGEVNTDTIMALSA